MALYLHRIRLHGQVKPLCFISARDENAERTHQESLTRHLISQLSVKIPLSPFQEAVLKGFLVTDEEMAEASNSHRAMDKILATAQQVFRDTENWD